jgi:putative membrane protein
MIPLAVCTINSLVWQVLSYAGVLERINVAAGFHSVSVFVQANVVSTALGFLLVFRLNRASVRWWECRTMWGMVIAYIRVLTSGICEHLSHSPKRRDQAVAWTAAFAVASKQMLRGETNISQAELAGVLSSDDVMRLQIAKHPPLYCCEEIRHAIQRAFPKSCCKDHAHSGDNVSAMIAQSTIIRSLESSIDALIINIGGMERIRVTPLPMVYVSHLRTFLLLYLLLLPYMIGESWGYFTVPTVFITSFSLLGIDGAAAECESPFQKSRVNHLDMDTFCQTAFKSVLQILIHAAERERREVLIPES